MSDLADRIKKRQHDFIRKDLTSTLISIAEAHYLAEGDWDENANARDVGHWCACCSDVSPCPTVQLITKGLRIK